GRLRRPRRARPRLAGRAGAQAQGLVAQWRPARRSKPYRATALVARNAKNATTTADGMIVLFPPAFVETMSGPNTASKSTASHITAIAREAHSSGTRSSDQRLQPCS